MPRLFILDAMGLAYRAYYAFIGRPLVSSKGENTSAIYGFANTALKIRRETSFSIERHRATGWGSATASKDHSISPSRRVQCAIGHQPSS